MFSAGGKAVGDSNGNRPAMLLAERLVRLLDTTLGKKNSFGVVFELLAYLVPHYLGTAIPAAFFWACSLASASCQETAKLTR